MFDFETFRKTVCKRDAKRVVLRTLEALVTEPMGPKLAKNLAKFVFEPNAREINRKPRPFCTSQSNLLIELEEHGLVRRYTEKHKTFWTTTVDGTKLLIQHKPEFGYLLAPIEGVLGGYAYPLTK